MLVLGSWTAENLFPTCDAFKALKNGLEVESFYAPLAGTLSIVDAFDDLPEEPM